MIAFPACRLVIILFNVIVAVYEVVLVVITWVFRGYEFFVGTLISSQKDRIFITVVYTSFEDFLDISRSLVLWGTVVALNFSSAEMRAKVVSVGSKYFGDFKR